MRDGSLVVTTFGTESAFQCRRRSDDKIRIRTLGNMGAFGGEVLDFGRLLPTVMIHTRSSQVGEVCFDLGKCAHSHCMLLFTLAEKSP